MPTTVASTVPAFLTALETALGLRAGLAGVQVATGPLGADTKNESIQVFDVEHDEEWAPLGARTRDESYVVNLACWSVKPGTEADGAMVAARNRVYAIAAEVAAALREAPHMGGDNVKVAAYAGTSLEQGTSDAGRWAQLNIRIRVEARLGFTA